MRKKIELGDTVKCIYTGFSGVATARTEFVNGCIQYVVAAKWNAKDKSSPEEIGIDEGSLVVVKKGKGVKKKEVVEDDDDEEERSNGGPMRKAPVRRNY